MSKVLIFRLGSIGDTAVAMPALWHIREYYGNAEIFMLTNFPVSSLGKECPLSTVLDGTEIVDEYIDYPIKKLGLSGLIKLRDRIRLLQPDVLIYLMPVRTPRQLLRDWLFFKMCGIPKIIGLRLPTDFQIRRYDPDTQLWEHESRRLARLISDLGPVDLDNPKSWSLALSAKELQYARDVLSELQGLSFFALSVGTKVDAKDWGQDRWLELTQGLAKKYPNYGLVLIGSHDEYERCKEVGDKWAGPTLNLAGKLSPRVSAAILFHAKLFIGHDSGPMHMAAACGTPIVAIFSARNKPGEWYPFGKQSAVVYHKTDCFGCNLDDCMDRNKDCIRSISVEEVLYAVSERID